MPKKSVTKAEGWKEIATATSDVQNRTGMMVEVLASELQPAGDEVGVILTPYKLVQYELEANEKLWALNRNENAAVEIGVFEV